MENQEDFHAERRKGEELGIGVSSAPDAERFCEEDRSSKRQQKTGEDDGLQKRPGKVNERRS